MTEPLRKCIACKAFSLKDSPPGLGNLGFGICAVRSMTKGHTFSALWPKQCSDFRPAAPATVAKRQKGLGLTEQEAN